MIEETLKKSAIFRVLNDDEISSIRSHFREYSYSDNQYIFTEGDPSDVLYLLVKGRVKMVKHSVRGRDVIVEIKTPGELFCCSAVLDTRPFPESAQAMEDVMVIGIRREMLLNFMDRYPELKVEIARYAGGKLLEAHEMLTNMATEKVERRIASLLLKLSETGGSGNIAYQKISLPLTRQEIADMIGTTVETCIRTISRFQKEGMVRTEGHHLLVNRTALRKFLSSL